LGLDAVGGLECLKAWVRAHAAAYSPAGGITRLIAVISRNETIRMLRIMERAVVAGDMGLREEANAPIVLAALQFAIRDLRSAYGKDARVGVSFDARASTNKIQLDGVYPLHIR
jgi:hypothetical protein